MSVCIEMFWRDAPMQERVRRVKALGFEAFEFWGWRNKNLEALHAAQTETGLALAAMVTEPSWVLVDWGNEQEVVEGVAESAAVALSMGCTRLICVPGITVGGESFEIARRRVVRKVKAMSKVAEDKGVTILLEPLNAIVDHKGAWLTRMCEAWDIVQEVGSPNVKILDDLYHQQLTEGNLIANITRYVAAIGHIHSAGVPGRHELLGGELDYRAIFAALKAAGYDGYIGLEFAPLKPDDAGLKEALSLI